MANYYRLEHAFVYIERDIEEITCVFGCQGIWPSRSDVAEVWRHRPKFSFQRNHQMPEVGSYLSFKQLESASQVQNASIFPHFTK